jgi:Xaa-Pro aminopeptidase
MNPAAERIASLRAWLRSAGHDACLIPNTDPHQSEYIAPHWQFLAWLSGFSGSAAHLVVSESFAGMWTDSRYFLQAEQQLAGSGIELMRLRVPHRPEYMDWLAEHLPPGGRLALDGSLFSVQRLGALEQRLAGPGIRVADVGDLARPLWPGRPEAPAAPLFLHKVLPHAARRAAKLARLRQQMAEQGADYHLIASPDDLAWLLELRGADVPFSPLFLAYGLISQKEAQLFVAPKKAPPDVRAALEADGVRLAPYEAAEAALGALPGGSSLLFDPARCNSRLKGAFSPAVRLIEGPQPSTALKAVKDEAEIACLREALLRDGLAWVRLLRWLLEEAAHPLAESEIAARFDAIRAGLPRYWGPSFPSIVGYGPNGAIVHYRPEPGRDAQTRREGLLLIDAGAQYEDGTTDLTRTLALGPVQAAHREDYTRVLRGHVALARAVFPAGTCGYQLDPLARQPLWAAGKNYGHGTGHGVGFFLSVHEGPPGLSAAALGPSSAALQPGMVLTNEPGLYVEGQYGIRIENILLCVPLPGLSDQQGAFLGFETLSLAPFDRRLIVAEMLEPGEREWIDRYHRRVFEQLSPALEPAERAWLEAETRPL